ncbi:uncharacterized protein LOC120348935 isoform X2 [Nilaparvata lugens]|nr:uncharacterized protein LOC120348935 isoform X2 [Nilaparvata lugens]
MSESTDRVLRTRSNSIVRQRRISTDHVRSRIVGELEGNHESAVFEDRLHGNGDVEINENLSNENFVRNFEEEESPWQNGHYKSASEIVAYYRSLGDWWNVLPKTDFNYDPTSKWYRKEIAPGIPMIPNMARPPLHPKTPKVPFSGWYTREQTNTRSSARDNSVSSSCSSAVKVSWYRRLVTTIVTAVTTIWVTVTSVTHITAGRTHNVNGIHAQRLKGRQLFQESNAWWRLPFVWLYRLMMNILAVDIGILAAVRRSANRLRSSRTGVELVTILLLLLPLMLFFDFYRGMISASLSTIYGWGSGMFSSVGSYWSQSQRSCETGYFDLLIDSISAGIVTVGQSAWQFVLYLYSFLLLLPTLLPSLPSTATIATGSVAKMAATNDHLQPAMSREQLIGIVQEAVRSTLKQDSAQLVDDTVRSEKLKVLLDQVELTTPGEMNLTQVQQDYVSVMIERALCLYDADKTGMVDYALESSGGHVLNTRCTESYNGDNGGHQTYVLFGFALWRSSNSPRTLIQPGMHPGECWAFSGQLGYVVLQLSSTIIVTGFTLEHIPRSLAPHGRIDSAPKDFSVWGLRDEDDKEETFLGRYRFQDNGTSLQTFKANAVEDPFRLVELKIESNHGNLEYTCLYRFRVHGVPVS